MLQRIMKALGYVRASEVKRTKIKNANQHQKFNAPQQWHTSETTTTYSSAGHKKKRNTIEFGLTPLQYDLLAKYASKHNMCVAECARQILRETIPPIKKNPHDRAVKSKNVNIASSKTHVVEILKRFDTTNSTLLANRIRAKLFV